MRNLPKVGEKVIAKETSHRWGYRKGDVLEVSRIGKASELIHAYNITQGTSGALLSKYEIKRARTNHFMTPTKRIYFFGIPIFTVKEVTE